MNMNEIEKNELETITNMYLERREDFEELISLEEFVKRYVRRCEYCGELKVIEDYYKELQVTELDGLRLSVCDECCEDIRLEKSDNSFWNEFANEYSSYVDNKLQEEF